MADTDPQWYRVTRRVRDRDGNEDWTCSFTVHASQVTAEARYADVVMVEPVASPED